MRAGRGRRTGIMPPCGVCRARAQGAAPHTQVSPPACNPPPLSVTYAVHQCMARWAEQYGKIFKLELPTMTVRRAAFVFWLWGSCLCYLHKHTRQMRLRSPAQRTVWLSSRLRPEMSLFPS